MEETDQYKTIDSPSTGIFKDKGSKFISYAYPVYDEEAIKEKIAALKKEYYDARHHCYAWQLGTSGKQFRANDDGEPSGTAGKPIHGQLKSNGLSNILVVVIRYFGGTKLGTSGLINAYREATIDAINNATIVEKTVDDVYQLSFDYGVMNDIMKIMKEENPNIIKQDFNLRCMIEWSCRQADVDRIKSRLEKIESVTVDFLKTI
ncbi:YigZ family protein [Carboxylicivirga sp. M1479]|uniref:IMPACT family protein n=1 Tax=Carboxylicivirga sp. M1479 TaxID=2594476 RepID=UPI00117871CA|nr:YigZ family protein [Carboxylicivirga sp. M1479]TRX63285.1 YigZ family protein [Carboxylicivirga sp. M1479]